MPSRVRFCYVGASRLGATSHDPRGTSGSYSVSALRKSDAGRTCMCRRRLELTQKGTPAWSVDRAVRAGGADGGHECSHVLRVTGFDK
eukprot:6313759-Prymnesium_polylepis.2